MDHAGGPALVSGDRPMMIGFCKREGAEEREPASQWQCRTFHDLVHVVYVNNRLTLLFDHPTKIFLKRDGSLPVDIFAASTLPAGFRN
jgi:hypothetical protein